jgi:hypothetical protein
MWQKSAGHLLIPHPGNHQAAAYGRSALHYLPGLTGFDFLSAAIICHND